MNCHAVAKSIGRCLKGADGLSGVRIYAHDTEVLASGFSDRVEEMKLPAIWIKVTADSLAGSATIGRMKAVVILGTQSDDETAATHAARELALRQRLKDNTALAAAFTAVGEVVLLGKLCIVDNDPGVEARAFVTPITCILGAEVES